MFKRFIEMLRSERDLSLEVKLQLINGLFHPFASLIAGALAGLWISATVTITVEDFWVQFVADFILVVALGRIAIGLRYITLKRPIEHHDMVGWEAAYAAGAFLFAVSLGMASLLAILRVPNEPLHLMLTTTTAAYAASITGRNAGRPWIALGQLYLAAGPMCLGLILHPTGFYQVVGYALLIFMFGMTDITLSVRQVLVGALETKRVNVNLAIKAQKQASLFDDALNNMSHGLCMFDAGGKLLVWNQKLLDILDHDGTGLVEGMNLQDMLASARDDRLGTRNSKLIDAIQQSALSKRARKSRVRLFDGTTIAVSRQTMRNGNVVIVFEDVTQQSKAQDRIQQLAWTDELTGLMNRASFKELLKTSLNFPPGTAGLALHLIDLDNFKVINDTLGHPIGDELLIETSKRILAAVGTEGHVARLGGDEFIVIQPTTEESTDPQTLANVIIAAIALPFEISNHRINVGASVGVALSPEHGLTGDVLLKRADMALYKAKGQGRHACVVFENELDVQMQQRRQLELDIRKAIAEDEFSLAFQPIVELATGKIVSLETLIRWRHPTRGYVSPAEFIPIAEETGLVITIGRWVLEEACKHASSWEDQSVSIAVNFSAVQFEDTAFPEFLAWTLAKTGLPANRLELEITETALLDDSQKTLEMLKQFRALGIGISLDDFGTGYSSLSQLRTFPFTKIKIDGSFVRDLGRDASSVAVIRAVCNIGQILNMAVVAECVESEEQLQFLATAGCSLIQGYLLGRPEPALRIPALLAEYAPSSIRQYLAA